MYELRKQDLENLKKIEAMIGEQLRLKPIEYIMPLFNNGYSCDEVGNVTGLNLDRAEIKDISFLADFPRLTHLRLSDNKIADLSPLQALIQLNKLNLYGNQVSDLSPLLALTQLTYLNLGVNEVSDPSPLLALTQLTYLNLGVNKVSDLSPLQALTQLKELYLDGNQITDLSPISALTQLTELDLRYNQIADLSPIRALLQKIEIQWEYNPFESGIFVYSNPLEIPPVEIVKQGNKAAAYFASLEKKYKKIDIKIDLQALKHDFFKLKDELAELAKKEPYLAEELRNITDSLDELSPETEKKELTKPLNKIGRLLEKLGDEDSRFNKMLKGAEKGVELAQKLGRTYNKFAQWFTLPQVPDVFLGEKRPRT